MFNVFHEKQGWIEVICGCMYSGKSEELIRRLKRASIAKQKVVIFKPKIDDRYIADHIVSHDQNKLKAHLISDPIEMLTIARDADVIGVDEAQFMNSELPQIVDTLAYAGKRVIIAGLDLDYRGVPFEPMPHLISIAETVTKTHAICVKCGNPAHYSQRTVEERDIISIGAHDKYEAVCRLHFIKPKGKA